MSDANADPNADGNADHNGTTPRRAVPDGDAGIRMLLRPITTPLPMGFLGLAGGTTLLSGLQLGWIPVPQSRQIGIAIVLVAVPLQLIASVMGYLARSAAAATGIGTLAVSWLTIGVLTALAPAGARSPLQGYLLFYLGAAVLVSALVAATGTGLPALVLALAAVRFALTGIYQYFGGTRWEHVAGWTGIALAALAVYAALAIELEDTVKRTVLPTLRFGSARTAVSAREGTEARDVSSEAGVRDRL